MKVFCSLARHPEIMYADSKFPASKAAAVACYYHSLELIIISQCPGIVLAIQTTQSQKWPGRKLIRIF